MRRVESTGIEKLYWPVWLIVVIGAVMTVSVFAQALVESTGGGSRHRAAFIPCSEMVDTGLYESIKRRTEEAINGGCDYLIYEIDTFGGRVDSAYDIWSYILQDVNKRPGLHTVAYVHTKAISAGALISVASECIVMKENTQLGDCAPISMGGQLEGVEREKIESPLRSFFATAAQANGYPEAILKAMVTVGLEVWQVRNLETDQFEYFEGDHLPTDKVRYDLEHKKRIDTETQLVTLSAQQAHEYGISQATVSGIEDSAREAVLAFLETRDQTVIERPWQYLVTSWSEQLVRWINSPAVSGILMLVGILGIYVEIKTPGIGLPAAIGVTAFVIMFGSKYLIGLANWWEIGVFVLGILLLLAEIFVIPGFGLAGVSGIILIFFGLIAMMVNNPPDQLPIPVSPMDWEIFQDYLTSMFIGLVVFVVLAFILARYLPGLPVARRLILTHEETPLKVRAGGMVKPAAASVTVGNVGVSASALRPCGIAVFDKQRLDVITSGELIEPGCPVKVVAIEGNEIIVQAEKGDPA